jgi:hypothetical protein
MDGLSQLLLSDHTIREKMSEAGLDFVHMQVLMNLYSLDASNSLHEYREVLPVYLATEWERCRSILDDLEHADLLSITEGEIALTHKIDAPEEAMSCGCQG